MRDRKPQVTVEVVVPIDLRVQARWRGLDRAGDLEIHTGLSQIDLDRLEQRRFDLRLIDNYPIITFKVLTSGGITLWTARATEVINESR